MRLPVNLFLVNPQAIENENIKELGSAKKPPNVCRLDFFTSFSPLVWEIVDIMVGPYSCSFRQRKKSYGKALPNGEGNPLLIFNVSLWEIGGNEYDIKYESGIPWGE